MASALSKAFDVIRVLRRATGPMSLTAIAETVGIAASTAHSVVTELLAHGVVVQDGDKRYRLGPAVYYWGSAFARNTPIFRATWRDLVDLSNDLGVVGALAVPWDEHHLILQAHNGAFSEIGVAFGGRVPLEGGSWGKAYYAWSGEPVPDKLRGFTPKTITDSGRFRDEVALTLEHGYATDDEEFTSGIAAVASGVTSEAGYEGLVSCLCSVAKMTNISYDMLGQRLAGIASRVSYSLGDAGRIRLVGVE